MRTAMFSFLFLVAGHANADAFYKLVGYHCDPRANTLVVTYDAAANSEGEAMMNKRAATQWDPWTLITMKDDDHIESLQTIVRTCKLSDGTYTVQFGPVPGNWNLQRRCGAWMSAWAEVRRGKQVVYGRADFEQGVGCLYLDGNITTRVEIRPRHGAPKITNRPAEQLLSGI